MNTNNVGYASFGARLAALIVDVIFLNLITVPLHLAIHGTEYLTGGAQTGGFATFFINWVLPAIITIGFWLTLAATPGKLLLSIRVVDAQSGERLTFVQGVARYIGYIVSLLPVLIGYFWMLRSPRRQTWHDLLAKTVVIRRDAPLS
jgi:uncharacterized RDD family membrane protein YckC